MEEILQVFSLPKEKNDDDKGEKWNEIDRIDIWITRKIEV